MFVCLPSIHPLNFDTVIERAQVLLLKPNPTSTLECNWMRKPSSCAERDQLASKCTSFGHQPGLGTFVPLSDAIRLYWLKTAPTFNPCRKLGGRKPSTCAERELLESKCSSCYRQSVLQTSLSLSNAPMCYVVKTKTRRPTPTLYEDRQTSNCVGWELLAPKYSPPLPSIRLINFATVLKRDQVLLP